MSSLNKQPQSFDDKGNALRRLQKVGIVPIFREPEDAVIE
jgi:hypothetical protein